MISSAYRKFSPGITAILGGHETLLYIRYENKEHARQEIRSFAVRNADAIIEQIRQCTDVVARLFIEYYCDSDNMDYHAVIGTADQVEAVRQKYHDEDSCDYVIQRHPTPVLPDRNVIGEHLILRVIVKGNCVVIVNVPAETDVWGRATWGKGLVNKFFKV